MPIASLYLALNALLLVALSFRVMRLRRRMKIALGEGAADDWSFRQARAAHQNSLENGLLALLLLFALEALGLAAWALHILGIAFLAGRLAYIYGLSSSPYASPGRVAGMAITWAVQIISALCLLALAIAKLSG